MRGIGNGAGGSRPIGLRKQGRLGAYLERPTTAAPGTTRRALGSEFGSVVGGARLNGGGGGSSAHRAGRSGAWNVATQGLNGGVSVRRPGARPCGEPAADPI